MCLTCASSRIPLKLPKFANENIDNVPSPPKFVAPVRPLTPSLPLLRPSLPFTPPPPSPPLSLLSTLTKLFLVLQVEDADPKEHGKGAEAEGITKKGGVSKF